MSITPPTPPLDPSKETPSEPQAPLIAQPDAMAHIGEEYGTGKENLPPTKLVGIILEFGCHYRNSGHCVQGKISGDRFD